MLNRKIILVEGLSGTGKSTYIKNRIENTFDNENILVIHGDRVRPTIKENVKEYFQENKSMLQNMLLNTAEDTIIIDGLMHTTEYDLIGCYELSRIELVEYYTKLFYEVNSSYFLVYICVPNIEKVIDETMSERKEKRKDWIEGITSFLEYSSLAKRKSWKGEIGIKAFLKYIDSYNEYLFDNLCIKKHKVMRG